MAGVRFFRGTVTLPRFETLNSRECFNTCYARVEKYVEKVEEMLKMSRKCQKLDANQGNVNFQREILPPKIHENKVC